MAQWKKNDKPGVFIYIRQNCNLYIKTIFIGENPPHFNIIAIKIKRIIIINIYYVFWKKMEIIKILTNWQFPEKVFVIGNFNFKYRNF